MNSSKNLPSTEKIKKQLSPLSSIEKWSIVLIPFITISAYFLFAQLQWYPLAFISLCYLSFVTYGSCCHDLVHANFGWSRKTCNVWLSFIEVLLLRSGTTYRITHLNHHRHYPDYELDPEGRASYFSLARTLLEGPVFHAKLVLWSLKNGNNQDRRWIFIELIFLFSFWTIGIFTVKTFPALIIYQIMVTLGAWIIPLITSYLVHSPHEGESIRQTKLYRGIFFRVVALDHLYHLEHHLYPQIPHCRWTQLAKILNPYFEKAQIVAIRIDKKNFKNLNLN